jgi:hypothetical protein
VEVEGAGGSKPSLRKLGGAAASDIAKKPTIRAESRHIRAACDAVVSAASFQNLRTEEKAFRDVGELYAADDFTEGQSLSKT